MQTYLKGTIPVPVHKIYDQPNLLALCTPVADVMTKLISACLGQTCQTLNCHVPPVPM